MRVVWEWLSMLCSTEVWSILTTEELWTCYNTNLSRTTTEITILHTFLYPIWHRCLAYLLLVKDVEELWIFLQPLYRLVYNLLLLLTSCFDS